MSDVIKTFQELYPTPESYWRSVILFGRNVASYKFALAKSLLEIVSTGKTIVSLEELAQPFSKSICEHIRHSPKQCTSASSKFLKTCQDYNSSEVSEQVLLDTTVKYGFNNVIDAFHTVNSESLPLSFFLKDYGGAKKRIILCDELFKLQEIPFFENFAHEVESRWNLVETAWELGVSRNLLSVQYDKQDGMLFVEGNNYRRKDVTSSRGALNGYQKGKCFYCFDDISLDREGGGLCDVDHFFPHILQQWNPKVNFNGMWNLVLSCSKCNRGSDGKFAKVPSLKYLERLHRRNEFLISSHHPLKETLMLQTGSNLDSRIYFLQQIDIFAINSLIHRWSTEQVGMAIF